MWALGRPHRGGGATSNVKGLMLRAVLRFLEVATNETRFERQGAIEHVLPHGVIACHGQSGERMGGEKKRVLQGKKLCIDCVRVHKM